MATPAATKPDRLTGLPPGVSVGPLGRRLVAQLVDLAVPLVLLLIILGLGGGSGSGAAIVIALVLIVVWCLLVWWMFATRAAGRGMRLMKLQLVGFHDGRPIGWVRFLVRALFLVLVTVTVVGLVVMLIVLLRHPRYQGWHDLAADSVVIVERPLAPRAGRTRTASGSRRTSTSSGGSNSPASPPPQDPAPLSTALPRGSSGADVGVGEPDSQTGGAGSDSPSLGTDEPTTGPDTAVWIAALDDGREVRVDGLVLLGRDPQPRPGEEGAELIKLADESRTVSKSHLALGLDESGLFVSDRGSTNGSMVTTADGARTRCAPGAVVHVTGGSVVSMGNHWFKVRRD